MPVLEIDKYAYAYPRQDAFLFRNIDLRVLPGECHCITGPTGIGKSTLLLAIQGLLPDGESLGRIQVCGNGRRDTSGLILQDPDMQILTKSIGQEVAFGLENLCVAPDEMIPLVKYGLKETGLEKELGFDTQKLSMGQKYRLILSALLVMKPRLLMLDEPSGHLDASGLRKLEIILRRLKESGVGILICEHRPEVMASIIDKYWLFRKGEGLQAGNAQPKKEASGIHKDTKDTKEFGRPVLSVDNISLGFENGPIWSDVSFTIYSGEKVVIFGENGSGKTTLLRSLLGMIAPRRGSVRVFGKKPSPERLRSQVGCLFQNPSKQLFENTVFEEAAFQIRRIGSDKIEEKVKDALALCGISDLSGCSPHKLSYGQKRLVALASVIGADPKLLLLDDPFTGLDHHTKEKVVYLLNWLSSEKETAIVLTTHHLDDEINADRRFYIKNRRIIEEQAWK